MSRPALTNTGRERAAEGSVELEHGAPPWHGDMGTWGRGRRHQQLGLLGQIPRRRGCTTASYHRTR